jgi:YggT family protein
MNPNVIELMNIALGVASYTFAILFVFNILKVDYFNPIVKKFIAFYKPISKISIFSNQLYMIFIIASFLNFISLYLLYSSQYDEVILGLIAIAETINSVFRIIFFALIGSVILSWVSPGNSHPFFRLVEEISSNALGPIRRFIPAFGGLDFSPLFALILIRQIEILLASFLRLII